METYADIIGLWPSAEALGDDIGESGVTVRAWRNRNSIPAYRWLDIVKAADARGIEGVSLDALARIAATRRPAPTPRTPKVAAGASA
jgi:hypothetical protein